MGVLGFLGDVAVGTLKIGGHIAAGVIRTAFQMASEANDVRNRSGHLSDRDLLLGATNMRNSAAQRVGYAQAYKDRHER